MYIDSNYYANLYGSNPQIDPTHPEDSDPELTNLLNEIYYLNYGGVMNNPPTQQELTTLAQGINNLMAYFSKNGAPNQKTDPAAYQIYQALTGTYIEDGSTPTSIAQIFSDLVGTDKTKATNALAALQSSAGCSFIFDELGGKGGLIDMWFHNRPPGDCGCPNTPFNNNKDANIEDDVNALMNALNAYNEDIKNGKDPKADLRNIANAIYAYNQDCQNTAGGLSDGYLIALQQFLGSSSDPNSLLSIASAVDPRNPTPAELTALQNALTGVGEDGSSGALSGIVAFAQWGEY